MLRTRLTFGLAALLFPLALLAVVMLTTAPIASQSALTVEYATFIGADAVEEGNGMGVDAAGNVYVGGLSQSNVFTPGIEADLHGVDIVSLKLNGDGSDLDYANWINVNPLLKDDEDHGLALQVDADGNAYLAGRTATAELCAEAGATGWDNTHNGGYDAFLMKFDPTGAITYCSFFGSAEEDWGIDIAIDEAGAVYMTGFSWSAAFPVGFNDMIGSFGGQSDLFVIKIAPDGNSVEYGAFHGGSGNDQGKAIALDSQNRVVVAGFSRSSDTPTTGNAYDPDYNGQADGFIVRLNAAGTAVNYASYFGTPDDDFIDTVTTGPNDSIVVGGNTFSADFPLQGNPYQDSFSSVNGFYPDGFVSVLSASNGLLYSTYLGGQLEDDVRDIHVLPDGAFYAVGWGSADFAGSGACGSISNDGYLLKLTPGSNALDVCLPIGGSDGDFVNELEVVGEAIYLVGDTRSADFPATAGSYDETANGDYDIFVMKLVDDSFIEPTPTPSVSPSPTPEPTATPTMTPSPELYLPYITNDE